MAYEPTISNSQEDILEVLREALGEVSPSASSQKADGHFALLPTDEGDPLRGGVPSAGGTLSGVGGSPRGGTEEIPGPTGAGAGPRRNWRRSALCGVAILLMLAALALGGFIYRDRIRQVPIVGSLGGAADRIVQVIGLKASRETHPPGHAGEATSATKEGEPEAKGPKILYYYDAMNPAYQSDKPGLAPDGMKLVPMYAEEAEKLAQMAPGTVMMGPEKRQLIGVRTEKVQVMPLVRTIRTVGRLTYDETRLARVHTKIPGWIEKIYVDFEGQAVKKGDPLFSLYSQDLVATQEEYLIALKGYQRLAQSPFGEISRGGKSLLEATRRRLELWDISDQQIEELTRSGKVRKSLTLYSPVNGIVLKREAYEQQMVTPETSVYTIADLSMIWVLADIYEYEFPLVRVGRPAVMTMPYFPGKTFQGKITYLYPYMEGETRTLKARIEFPNPDLKLRPDMYADVSIRAFLGRSAVVSEEAVLDSGERKIVFVDKGEGYFEPREVKLGVKLDHTYQILAGLSPGEVVVTSGNFLIDSESRLVSATSGVGHVHGGSAGESAQPMPESGGGRTPSEPRGHPADLPAPAQGGSPGRPSGHQHE